jgi:ribose transport system substrate-binding protein
MTRPQTLLAASALALSLATPAMADPDLSWFAPQTEAMTAPGAYQKDGPWTVALVFPDLSNSWRVQAVEEARLAAEANDRIAELIVTNYREDVSVMVSDMEDMIARGVDAIMVHTGQVGLLGEAVKSAEARGIPVINFGQIDPQIDYPVQMWAGGESYGRTGGAWLAETLGGAGEVWALRGVAGHSEDVARFTGMQEALAGTEIAITREDYGAWSYEGAKPLCESWVLSGDLPDAIWSSGADMTRACVAASFPPSMFAVGLNAVEALLSGETLARVYWAEPEPITGANLAEYYHDGANDNLWVPTTLSDADIARLFPR